MRGIVSYGVHIPRYRLRREAIAAALRAPAGKGTRSVASHDEDTTSMGVEAGRVALRSAGAARPDLLLFATPSPAYLDKTNATAIHAALGLAESTPAFDMGGASKSATGVFRVAAERAGTTLVIASDIRTGLVGSADESSGGDAAVAFVMGSDAVIAEMIGAAAATREFADRWRTPGEQTSRVWEERFGETAYLPLAQAAAVDALKQANLTIDQIDAVVVAGLQTRAAGRVGAAIGAQKTAVASDLTASIGNTGAAHFGVGLADVLDRAEPNQVILVVSLADGADAMLLRTTEAISDHRAGGTVADQVAAGDDSLSYTDFLTWRAMVVREPARRPDPDRPAPPPSLRTEAWKFGFVGSRCDECGTRHLPPQRVCMQCDAVDRMSEERLADIGGTVTTFAIDNLAYSLNPPVVVGVIDFDGGGRYQCELTDVDPAAVRIGDRVEMTFRRLYTAGGIHNYFWKARPVRRSGN